jgi:NAD-dependent SIR2 family protein deacetylase
MLHNIIYSYLYWTMALERLYELIRKEDVVLFCGAGMSIYAGFPSGNQLAQVIYDQLTTSEAEEIPAGLTLPDLCEQLVDLRKSKNSLIALLKKLYNNSPTDYSLHQKIAGIPHIKTVITTNYDRLFEAAYGDGCSVVRQSTDLSYLNKALPEIFKIHGDLTVPDSILITKTDYTKFFDSQKENALWTVIKERITTHNVLFIGYSLDDINMESIFRKLRENLGDNHKEIFLLAPNLKAPKINRLAKDDIHYIDNTADVFIDRLLVNIENNIRKDFDNQWCSPETFRIFLQTHNLAPTITAEDDQFKVLGMQPTNGQVTSRLTFRVTEAQKEIIEKFENIIQNKELGSVTLDERTVTDLNVFMNGIKISTGSDGPLIFSSVPAKTSFVDLVFASGAEFEEIKVEVYGINAQIIFVVKIGNVELKVTTSSEGIMKSQFDLKFQRNGHFGKLSDELRIISLLKELSTEQDINIFIKNQSPLKFKTANVAELGKFTEKHFYYFERLKKIERHFNVKFDEIGEINEQTYITLNIITAHIDGEPYLGVYDDGWRVTPTHQDKALLMVDQIKPESNLVQKSSEPETFDFHGRQLLMGYKQTQLLEPYIPNEEEVRKNPLFAFRYLQ